MDLISRKIRMSFYTVWKNVGFLKIQMKKKFVKTAYILTLISRNFGQKLPWVNFRNLIFSLYQKIPWNRHKYFLGRVLWKLISRTFFTFVLKHGATSQCKNWKIFRQTNSLVISSESLQTLLSRNICQECVTVRLNRFIAIVGLTFRDQSTLLLWIL